MVTKQRKPVEDLRVPLNCLIAPSTKELITELQNDTKESQGEIVDRAISVLMDITPERTVRKLSRRDRAVKERVETDIVAQQAERDDIDYSDVDSTPTTIVANLRGSIGAMSAATRHTTEKWRANRKPLPKPKDR
jgi:hypothetical protein